ncbi:MAG: LemA family protein [Candidatus Omnitrophica bacterium]|jgi:LemA protein|nr:LemA family protein [Candidatus Omnitrophota bacterium]
MGLVVLIILGGMVVVALAWFFGIYNNLIALRVRVENAVSQIDVQLKRRHDLIPNLVEAVKGYMAHEKDTLERVIKARMQAIDAKGLQDKAASENFLSQTLRSLFAVFERYPDLKANQNVLQLQEELISTENRITFARQYYNDEAGRFNTLIQTVPVNIVAQLGGFIKKDFFEVGDPQERQAPQVKF